MDHVGLTRYLALRLSPFVAVAAFDLVAVGLTRHGLVSGTWWRTPFGQWELFLVPIVLLFGGAHFVRKLAPLKGFEAPMLVLSAVVSIANMLNVYCSALYDPCS